MRHSAQAVGSTSLRVDVRGVWKLPILQDRRLETFLRFDGEQEFGDDTRNPQINIANLIGAGFAAPTVRPARTAAVYGVQIKRGASNGLALFADLTGKASSNQNDVRFSLRGNWRL